MVINKVSKILGWLLFQQDEADLRYNAKHRNKNLTKF